MKLLLENWRQFIKEEASPHSVLRRPDASSYFGQEFADFKKRVARGEDPNKVAKDMLKPIGVGSTRRVYGFTDNPDIVLKIILESHAAPRGIGKSRDPLAPDPKTGFTTRHKKAANEWEGYVAIQQKYPGVFPKSYEIADDFSWILTEKVEEAKLPEIMDLLGLKGVTLGIGTFAKDEAFTRIMMKLVDHLRQRFGGKGSPDVEDPRWAHLSDPLKKPAATGRGAYLKNKPLNIMRKMLESKDNQRLFLAIAELGIPADELRPDNFGISTQPQRHLVLLDTSLWDDPKAAFPTSREFKK